MSGSLRTEYATYVIFFHDRNEYEFAIAAVGGTPETGGNFEGSPVSAANFFGIPIPFPSGNMDDIPKGIYYNSVYHDHYQANPDSPPDVFLEDDDDDGVIVPAFNSSSGTQVGTAYRLVWSGTIVYMVGSNGEPPATPIPQRRWIGGLEFGPLGEGGTGIATSTGCRDSSRTLDGVGYPVRGADSGTVSWLRTLAEYAANTPKSWERFYIRLRVAPSTETGFWKTRNSISASKGVGLRFTAGGAIELYESNNLGVITSLQTSSPLELNKWYKIDVIFEYEAAPLTPGPVWVVINGTIALQQLSLQLNGGDHSGSEMGITLSGDALLEYDFDDWINAAWPGPGGVTFTGDCIDFLCGSHVRRAFSNASSQVNYTPLAAPQILNQGHNAPQAVNSQLTSTTSGALLAGLTDLPLLGVQDKMGEVAIGAVAALIGANTLNAGGTDGELGYDNPVSGIVMSSINEIAGGSWNTKMYRPSGMVMPLEITPFFVRYTKSADVNSASVRALGAVVEYIGIWGQEDVIDPTLFPEERPRINWIHNCRYPNTPYGYMGPSPATMTFAVGGTYVGNGTETSVALPDAPHMIFIRALTGGSLGMKWFAASMGAHPGIQEQVIPGMRVWYDDVAGQFQFTVTGTYVESNANGVTFQYIAYCDPGMRFCSMGAYKHPSAITSRVNTLQNPDLTPLFLFLQKEVLGTTSTSIGTYARGPGNTGSVGNPLNGSAAITNFATFGAGQFTTEAGAHFNVAQVNYAAFRTTDDCGFHFAQIITYTGNGAGSQVIPLTPVTSCFPLFVLVIPTSGAQAPIFRDPSHAGANSARFDTLANTATGVTAVAVDSITVGSSLNTNAVIYNVFVIPGDTAAMNNGVFYPPMCDEEPPWFNPPQIPPDIAVMGDGGLSLNGSVPLTLLKDISGIYTLVPGKTNDTLYDRQTGQANIDVEIPDPSAKTGYIGG
jgi:hypothetical protein